MSRDSNVQKNSVTTVPKYAKIVLRNVMNMVWTIVNNVQKYVEIVQKYVKKWQQNKGSNLKN